jgi:hypothetical protein
MWRDACVFLTAYGWHKDITIYEVLDPFPLLIDKDPAAARKRMSDLQALTNRVPIHTDLRETRGAWTRWWSLLAKVDPVATARISVVGLLRECNDPNALLNDAAGYLWNEWHETVDPLIAGVLRLSLDLTLAEDDAVQIARLAEDGAATPRSEQLMQWLLARADERPTSYSATNSPELLEADDIAVHGLNAVAEAAGAGPLTTVRQPKAARSSQWDRQSVRPRLQHDWQGADIFETFGEGASGLAKAIRAWRRKPYEGPPAQWAAERFANVIGYRLLDLVAEGRTEEAANALLSLTDGGGLGDRSQLLRMIAEGLKRHGENELAAVAFALAWTRTRGHGGWLTFGGETEIEALREASELGSEAASRTVARDVQHAVASSRYGTYGISQAIIRALAVGGLTCPDMCPTDAALAAWDEAFGVVAARAPRVGPSDDPEIAYVPPEDDEGEATPGSLEVAFALATLGGLAHPSRERKRRALLATQLLIEERPSIAGEALATTLGDISDVATLTWLLCVMEDSADDSVLAACQPVLRSLASRPQLSVRAIARRLLSGELPPLPAPSDTSVALEGLLLSDPEVGDVGTDQALSLAAARSEAEANAGRRLVRGERLLPGLSEKFLISATSALRGEPMTTRLGRQLDEFADSLTKRWPDAFLAPEQIVEEILQTVAAGGRTDLLARGIPAADPTAWEDELARLLTDHPRHVLGIEATRWPRPALPQPPDFSEGTWTAIRDRIDSAVERCPDAAEHEGLLLATVSTNASAEVSVAEHGRLVGWRWVATIERRSVLQHDYRNAELFAKRYRAIEVRDVGDEEALTLPPLAVGDVRQWFARVHPDIGEGTLSVSTPLIGMDSELLPVQGGQRGLGWPDSLLTPTALLVASLGLGPGDPWTMEDENGVGLALVTWRAEYDTSDYHLPRPLLRGAGVLMRPDLFDVLTAVAGPKRLVFRDFVVGDSELAEIVAQPVADEDAPPAV